MPKSQKHNLIQALLLYAVILLLIFAVASSDLSNKAKIILGVAAVGFFVLFEVRIVRRMSDVEKNVFGLITTSILAAMSLYSDMKTGKIRIFSYFLMFLVIFGFVWTLHSFRRGERGD